MQFDDKYSCLKMRKLFAQKSVQRKLHFFGSSATGIRLYPQQRRTLCYLSPVCINNRVSTGLSNIGTGMGINPRSFSA